MRFCTECGMRLDDSAEFCTECGTVVESNKETVMVEPVVESENESEAAEPVTVAQEPVIEQTDSEQVAAVEPITEETETAVEPIVPFAVAEPAVEQPTPTGDERQAIAPAPIATQQEPPQGKAKEPLINFRDKSQTLSTGQYFWSSVLFSIPILGLVFLFIWGCGEPKNGSLKRFSLAMLIARLLIWIIIVGAGIAFIILFRNKLDAIANAFYHFGLEMIGAIGF